MKLKVKVSAAVLGFGVLLCAFGANAFASVVGHGIGTTLYSATQDAISDAQEQCVSLGYSHAYVQNFNTTYQFGYYFVAAEATCS